MHAGAVIAIATVDGRSNKAWHQAIAWPRPMYRSDGFISTVGWATRLHGPCSYTTHRRCPLCRSYEQLAERVGKSPAESRTVGRAPAGEFALSTGSTPQRLSENGADFVPFVSAAHFPHPETFGRRFGPGIVWPRHRLAQASGSWRQFGLGLFRPSRTIDAAAIMTLQLIWPWQDRRRRFSWLKASTFALMLYPALRTAYLVGAGDYGSLAVAFGSLTYWSGVWATVVLLMALAITPAARIFRRPALIDVRRMVGVAALVYTLAHIIMYFAMRRWEFTSIVNDMTARLTLIVATLSTIGLDRARRDLCGCRDPIPRSEELAAAAHHELCDQRSRDPSYRAGTRHLSRAVHADRTVRLADAVESTGPTRPWDKCQGAGGARVHIVPRRGVSRGGLPVVAAWFRCRGNAWL